MKRRRVHRRHYNSRRAHGNRAAGRAGILVRVLALFVVCLMPFLLFRTAAASEQEADIEIKASTAKILQGEAVPAFSAEITVSGNEKAVLDKRTGYTVREFERDLKAGKYYKVQTESDGTVEGEFPVKITLDREITEALQQKWIGLVTIETSDGRLTVKNPVGTWEGDKFKRYDGSYVVNDFVVSKGQTYYFGEDGVKVTGLQALNNGRYYFGPDGSMQTGWQELDGARYYFGERGAAAVGWLDLDGAAYYFDEEGKMAVGEQRIGMEQCIFGDDGKLVSRQPVGVDPGKPMVALTFDDGPGPRTAEILESLAQNNAHATFFMLGQKVPSYPSVISRMKELGCELGNHSFDHKDLSKLDAGGVQGEIGQTNDNLSGIVGAGATVMRPPYGAISGTMKSTAGMPMILWNIDTLDWKTRNAQKTIDAVMGTVKDGDIILMHDIHTESVDAALKLIPMLKERGFQLVTVSEMAAAKGVSLQPGSVYTDF